MFFICMPFITALQPDIGQEAFKIVSNGDAYMKQFHSSDDKSKEIPFLDINELHVGDKVLDCLRYEVVEILEIRKDEIKYRRNEGIQSMYPWSFCKYFKKIDV